MSCRCHRTLPFRPYQFWIRVSGLDFTVCTRTASMGFSSKDLNVARQHSWSELLGLKRAPLRRESPQFPPNFPSLWRRSSSSVLSGINSNPLGSASVDAPDHMMYGIRLTSGALSCREQGEVLLDLLARISLRGQACSRRSSCHEGVPKFSVKMTKPRLQGKVRRFLGGQKTTKPCVVRPGAHGQFDLYISPSPV